MPWSVVHLVEANRDVHTVGVLEVSRAGLLGRIGHLTTHDVLLKAHARVVLLGRLLGRGEGLLGADLDAHILGELQAPVAFQWDAMLGGLGGLDLGDLHDGLDRGGGRVGRGQRHAHEEGEGSGQGQEGGGEALHVSAFRLCVADMHHSTRDGPGHQILVSLVCEWERGTRTRRAGGLWQGLY